METTNVERNWDVGVAEIKMEGRYMSQIRQGSVLFVGYDIDGMWRMETRLEGWKLTMVVMTWLSRA